jgi:hypothetical protein
MKRAKTYKANNNLRLNFNKYLNLTYSKSKEVERCSLFKKMFINENNFRFLLKLIFKKLNKNNQRHLSPEIWVISTLSPEIQRQVLFFSLKNWY